MNTSLIATAVTLRELKCYSLETINDRILLQKKVYLAQDIGLPLGYGYSWYIHGPYSSDLTTAAYQIIPEGLEAIDGKVLKEPYMSIIKKVNQLEEQIKTSPTNIGIVPWYELLSSIAYWMKIGYSTKQSIIKRIKDTKPQFSDEQIKHGYDVYKEFKAGN